MDADTGAATVDMSLEAREPAHAEQTLRLLLERSAPPPSRGMDWELWGRIAQRNRVLVRLAERLSDLDHAAPPAFTEAAKREGERARAFHNAVRRVDAACVRWSIPHVFLKVTRHYPDAGGDVDMLVPRGTPVDERFISDLQATPRRRGLGERLAGSSGFLVDGDVVFDVHHGRLGLCGEQRALAEFLLERGRPVEVGGATIRSLSPNDEVLLQGAQLVSGRRSFRMTEVIYTISTIRAQRLDWDELLRSAERLGVLAGLSCYLTYVARIHYPLFGHALLPDTVARRLSSRAWGDVKFRDGEFHFPRVTVGARVYLGQLATDLIARRWGSAARVSVMSVAAVAAALLDLI